MIRDEFFPRGAYPLRARTKVFLPEMNITLYEERFYQNPITHVSEQKSGVYVIGLSPKHTPLFSYTRMLHPDDAAHTKCYLVQGDSHTEITEVQLDALKDQWFGSENSCKIVHLIVNAQWESF